MSSTDSDTIGWPQDCADEADDGAQGVQLFTPAALDCISAVSAGNPALVNQLCDNALLDAFGDAQVYKSSLDVGGEYAYRTRGEDHAWTAESVSTLQHAVRGNSLERYRAFRRQYEIPPARLDTLTRHLDSAKARAPRTVLETKQRLQERIRELTEGLEMDPVRLSQEVALLAEKSDITEEIVRFESHIGQMEKLLQGNDAIGRKLDFLLQEMGREVNTLGSKSNDIAIGQDVIELKSELAKLREQAQNVE